MQMQCVHSIHNRQLQCMHTHKRNQSLGISRPLGRLSHYLVSRLLYDPHMSESTHTPQTKLRFYPAGLRKMAFNLPEIPFWKIKYHSFTILICMQHLQNIVVLFHVKENCFLYILVTIRRDKELISQTATKIPGILFSLLWQHWVFFSLWNRRAHVCQCV